MVSRVTTAQRFNVARRTIQTTQSRVQEIQESIVTGKRVIKPSDDPGSFSKILSLRRIINDGNQFRKNIQRSTAFANVTDQSLQDIRNLLVQARGLGIQETGAPGDSVTRANAAVQIDRIRESILQIANTQVGNRFIFSGSKIFSKAYNEDGVFQGDNGKLNINVGLNNASPINISGSSFLSTDLDPDLYQTSALTKGTDVVTEEFIIQAGVNDVLRIKDINPALTTSITLGASTSTGAALATELELKINNTIKVVEASNNKLTIFEDSGKVKDTITLTAGVKTAVGLAGEVATALNASATLQGAASTAVITTGVNNLVRVDFDGNGTGDATLDLVGGGVVSGAASTPTQIAAQLQAQLNTDPGGGNSDAYTVAFDNATRKYTITAGAGNADTMRILWDDAITTAEADLGFTGTTTLAPSGTATSSSNTIGYSVEYDAATDKFTVATSQAAAKSVGVDVSATGGGLEKLMGFTTESDFLSLSDQSDLALTGTNVTYDKDTDRFTISRAGGASPEFQVLSAATDGLSTAANTLGFTVDSLQARTASSATATAFNVFTGTNDTFSVAVDGGTNTAITIGAGNFTGATLAAKIELAVNNKVKQVTATNNTITIQEDGAARTETFTLGAGTKTGAALASELSTLVNASVTLKGAASTAVITTGVNNLVRVDFDGNGTGDATLDLVGGGVVSGAASTPTQIAAQLQAQLNTDPGGGNSDAYTVAFDNATRKYTITAGAGNADTMRILWDDAITTAEADLGFTGTTTLAPSGTATSSSNTIGYGVEYDAATDKFTINSKSPAVSVGVDVSKTDLGSLMGFTKTSPFSTSVTSDTNITGAKVDYNTSFKDSFNITSPTVGSSSSIALTVGGTDILNTLNLNGAVLVASKSTSLTDLNGGTGVSSGSISITNRAGSEFTIDLTSAANITDVISKIEAVVTGVKVTIGSDGKRLVLTDTNSPVTSNLTVKEIGQTTTAFDLGILANTPGNIIGRDIDPKVSSDTVVSALRDGLGARLGKVKVGLAEIDLALGSQISVNDLLQAITGNATANATATISGDGTSLKIASKDNTSSALVTDVTGSSVRDLGFQGANDVIGLLNVLEEAMLRNDGDTINRTLDEFTDAFERISQQQVVMGEVVRQFERVSSQQEEIILAFGEILSKEEDTDLTQAITQFSVFQTSLEAAFASTAQILKVSILDFLR